MEFVYQLAAEGPNGRHWPADINEVYWGTLAFLVIVGAAGRGNHHQGQQQGQPAQLLHCVPLSMDRAPSGDPMARTDPGNGACPTPPEVDQSLLAAAPGAAHFPIPSDRTTERPPRVERSNQRHESYGQSSEIVKPGSIC